jgi:threonine/homoserine efflux transporter RhtA
MTNKRIARNCDRFVEVCGVPETETVYKDTTIYLVQDIPIPQDSVAVTGDVLVVDGKAEMDRRTIESQLITLDVGITKGKLEVYSYINKEVIPINMNITLERAIRETSEVQVIRTSYIPKAYKWSFWIVLAELTLIVIGVVQKFTSLNMVGIVLNLLSKLKFW